MKRKNRINFKDYSGYPVIVDDLFEFNEKYIRKSIDLEVHKNSMDETIYGLVKKALAEQYAAELQLKRAQSQSKTDEKFYMAESLTDELAIYAVRRYRHWQNSQTKEILDKRIAAEAGGYFAELQKGLEPDEISELFYKIIDEFAPVIKRNRIVRKRREYLTWLLAEYAQSENLSEKLDELTNLIADELVPEKRHKKFIENNGKYLKGLLSEYLLYNSDYADAEPAYEATDDETADDTAEQPETASEPTEEADSEDTDLEDEYDEAAEFERLRELEEPEPDEADAETETDSESTSEEPAQEQIEIPLVAVPYSSMPVFVPQNATEQSDAGSEESAEETAETGNADGETGNE